MQAGLQPANSDKTDQERNNVKRFSRPWAPCWLSCTSNGSHLQPRCTSTVRRIFVLLCGIWLIGYYTEVWTHICCIDREGRWHFVPFWRVLTHRYIERCCIWNSADCSWSPPKCIESNQQPHQEASRCCQKVFNTSTAGLLAAPFFLRVSCRDTTYHT